MVTTLKHNFSILNSTNNPILGAIFEVYEASTGILIYAILIVLFTVSAYILNKRTQDTEKSFITALHITAISAILLYYAGKTSGYTLVPEVIMLGLLVIEAISIAAIYFVRSDKLWAR